MGAIVAANQALAIYRSMGDRQCEAHALIASAKGLIAHKKAEKAYEAVSQALLLFRECGDWEGEELAKSVIDTCDRILNPLEPWLQEPQVLALLPQDKASASARDDGPTEAMSQQAKTALKGDIRAIVTDIAAMDDIVDDSPLMNMGLTSQSAVLLRNSISKQFPGPSLPFTMMFDFPSINA